MTTATEPTPSAPTRREQLWFEVTTTTTGSYCVDAPEDATWEQLEAIRAVETAKWEAGPAGMLEEKASSYDETFEFQSLNWD